MDRCSARARKGHRKCTSERVERDSLELLCIQHFFECLKQSWPCRGLVLDGEQRRGMKGRIGVQLEVITGGTEKMQAETADRAERDKVCSPSVCGGEVSKGSVHSLAHRFLPSFILTC